MLMDILYVNRQTFVSRLTYSVVYTHMTKAICHSYKACTQTFVCMVIVAMGTPRNKVKMPFFIICNIFLLFPNILITISIPHHGDMRNKVKMPIFIICNIFLLFPNILIKISIPHHVMNKPNFCYNLSYM